MMWIFFEVQGTWKLHLPQILGNLTESENSTSVLNIFKTKYNSQFHDNKVYEIYYNLTVL